MWVGGGLVRVGGSEGWRGGGELAGGGGWGVEVMHILVLLVRSF